LTFYLQTSYTLFLSYALFSVYMYVSFRLSYPLYICLPPLLSVRLSLITLKFSNHSHYQIWFATEPKHRVKY